MATIKVHKLRHKFFNLMYLLFLVMYAEGMNRIDEAQAIIDEQAAYIALHNKTQEEVDTLTAALANMKREKDSTINAIHSRYTYIKSEYAKFGYDINWEKAYELNGTDEIHDSTIEFTIDPNCNCTVASK